LAQAVEAEIKGTITRAAIAQAMASASQTIKFNINSTLQIGSFVHKCIQTDYRDHFFDNDIAVERWNADAGYMEQFVIGPVTNMKAMSLAAAASKPSWDPDAFWRTLRVALSSPRIER